MVFVFWPVTADSVDLVYNYPGLHSPLILPRKVTMKGIHFSLGFFLILFVGYGLGALYPSFFNTLKSKVGL